MARRDDEIDEDRRLVLVEEGTSRRSAERELTLQHRKSGVPDSLGDVVGFEVRVFFRDLRDRHPVGNHGDDGRNREAQVAHTRHAAHAFRVHGDPVEGHEARLLTAATASPPIEHRMVCLARLPLASP